MLVFFKKIIFIIGLIGLLLLMSACKKSQMASDSGQIDLIAAAKINTKLGMSYLDMGNTRRAKKKLLLALYEDPSLPDAHSAMGYYLEKTGETEKAEAYYVKAIKLSSSKAAEYNRYGAFLCRQGKYHEAIDYFVKAASIPQYLNVSEAYQQAALCAEKIPDSELARKFSEQLNKQRS